MSQTLTPRPELFPHEVSREQSVEAARQRVQAARRGQLHLRGLQRNQRLGSRSGSRAGSAQPSRSSSPSGSRMSRQTSQSSLASVSNRSGLPSVRGSTLNSPEGGSRPLFVAGQSGQSTTYDLLEAASGQLDSMSLAPPGHFRDASFSGSSGTSTPRSSVPSGSAGFNNPPFFPGAQSYGSQGKRIVSGSSQSLRIQPPRIVSREHSPRRNVAIGSSPVRNWLLPDHSLERTRSLSLGSPDVPAAHSLRILTPMNSKRAPGSLGPQSASLQTSLRNSGDHQTQMSGSQPVAELTDSTPPLQTEPLVSDFGDSRASTLPGSGFSEGAQSGSGQKEGLRKGGGDEGTPFSDTHRPPPRVAVEPPGEAGSLTPQPGEESVVIPGQEINFELPDGLLESLPWILQNAEFLGET